MGTKTVPMYRTDRTHVSYPYRTRTVPVPYPHPYPHPNPYQPSRTYHLAYRPASKMANRALLSKLANFYYDTDTVYPVLSSCWSFTCFQILSPALDALTFSPTCLRLCPPLCLPACVPLYPPPRLPSCHRLCLSLCFTLCFFFFPSCSAALSLTLSQSFSPTASPTLSVILPPRRGLKCGPNIDGTREPVHLQFGTLTAVGLQNQAGIVCSFPTQNVCTEIVCLKALRIILSSCHCNGNNTVLQGNLFQSVEARMKSIDLKASFLSIQTGKRNINLLLHKILVLFE